MVKKMILVLIIGLITTLSYSQTLDTIFNGYLSPFRALTGSSPTWTTQGKFINEDGLFSAASAGTDCKILVSQGGRCYELTIDTVYNTGSNVYATVTDSSGLLTSLPSVAAILRPTPTKGLYPYISGLPDKLQSCIEIHNQLMLDTLTAAGAGLDSTSVTASDILFDSNRPILREYTAGVNIGGTTLYDFLNYPYFVAPSINLVKSPTTTFYEIGTSNTISLTTVTTNAGGATLSNGTIDVVSPSYELLAFGSSTTSGPRVVTYTPLQTPIDTFDSYSYTFRATQDWVSGAESGTITNDETIGAGYPVFYGMVADTATAFVDIYNTMTKLVQSEGNKTLSFTGTGLIFYCIPATWTDTNLSSIVDPNGFNVTASFTRVTYPVVTSDDITNDYTNVAYIAYFLNTGSTTTSASNYTFNR